MFYLSAKKPDKLSTDSKINWKLNMLNPDKINEITNKIKEMVNTTPLADLEKNIHALIQGAFTKMELISREEFDVQSEVLRNTREKLIQLECKLAALEAKAQNKVKKIKDKQ